MKLLTFPKDLIHKFRSYINTYYISQTNKECDYVKCSKSKVFICISYLVEKCITNCKN